MKDLVHFNLPQEAGSRFPFSQAVSDGNLLFVAGQIASDDPDWSGLPGDIEVQTHRVMQRIGRVLATAGLDFGDVMRVSLYMTNLGDFELMNAVYRTYFSDPKLPARTCVGVANLLDKQVIEIDCVARLR
jgi:2-iminobutanoate/2-iminopropanoate deaminase